MRPMDTDIASENMTADDKMAELERARAKALGDALRMGERLFRGIFVGPGEHAESEPLETHA